jgi:hypothetical protein
VKAAETRAEFHDREGFTPECGAKVFAIIDISTFPDGRA